MSRQYDIMLCGATGFTGKLAIEYMLSQAYDVRFAVCVRNEEKAKSVLTAIGDRLGKPAADMPAIEVADLVGDEARLRTVVAKAKVVITTAGPFEKYGQALCKICAEEGVQYADITGESDYFRAMIEKHDASARRSGATIVLHCGHDCVPWDLTVYEMSRLAASRDAELVEASTFTELPSDTAMSGGTLTTAMYQLGKRRKGERPAFDPLVRLADGNKSEYETAMGYPKRDVYFSEFGKKGGPWIMQPVMANCVRRSNALLGYSKRLAYSEAQLREAVGFAAWLKGTAYGTLVAAAIALPSVFGRFLPAAGEGPPREWMEKEGFLTVHGRGVMVDKASGRRLNLTSTFRFDEDVTYLCTAKMLVECGMLLLEKASARAEGGGVVGPAVAFGSSVVQRCVERIGAKFEINVAEEEEAQGGAPV